MLPPENATGNWVKVVQRVTVRLELDEIDPDRELYLGHQCHRAGGHRLSPHMAASVSSRRSSRRRRNERHRCIGISAGGRRIITVAALMATYMQGVNISIPNAALSHMQGSLSMADDEIGWLFTSYIAGSVIVMPLTPWLAGRYGRKAVFQISLVIFALGLVLDTVATTPIQFVLARIVQGAASGPLAPISAAIFFDIHPRLGGRGSVSRWRRVGCSASAAALASAGG